MKLIERYVFRRMAAAFALTFVALGAMVWLSQALRAFNLVTANGQSLWTFLHVTAFLIPVLVVIVLPIAALIAVIYAFATLNGDSELVVVNASGASQFMLVRPVLLIGLITTVLVATMSLYFAPLSIRLGQVLITAVRANILSSIMREGQFMQLAPGLSFLMKGRNADGSLSGIFVADDRDADRAVTYLAERGAILENPLGVFLIMADGTIQRRNKIDHSISIIEFSSYAFDLSTFSSRGEVPALTPRERPTEYLVRPDPNDPYFRQFPDEFRAELHGRLTTPLYGFVFALMPLLFLGQAESPRESRTASITMAVVAVLIVRGLGFIVAYFAETDIGAVIMMYALPLGVSTMVVILVLTGTQLRPPERLIAFAEGLFGRVSGLMRNRAEAAAGGSR